MFSYAHLGSISLLWLADAIFWVIPFRGYDSVIVHYIRHHIFTRRLKRFSRVLFVVYHGYQPIQAVNFVKENIHGHPAC